MVPKYDNFHCPVCRESVMCGKELSESEWAEIANAGKPGPNNGGGLTSIFRRLARPTAKR
jgi:hypothetical protein